MKVPRWRLIISFVLTGAIFILAYVERAHIVEAFSLLRGARPVWLLAALGLSFASFFITSLVYRIGLRSLGYRHVSGLWLWATTVVALILSQAIPAGGVASYAFLAQSMRRRGIPAGHSTLLATLEAVTYVSAMLLLFGYSLVYLTVRSGVGAAEDASLAAALVAVLIIGTAVFVLTRDAVLLTRWLTGLKNIVGRLLRRELSDGPIHRLVDELTRGRTLIIARPSMLLLLLGVQLTALIGHSMVMLLVLQSLGAPTTPQVVIAGFGVVLITSSFNVLPGGGGTVETALALTLAGLGVGKEGIPAAVIFRLINFWIMVPIAFICYRWVMYGQHAPIERTVMAAAAEDEPAAEAEAANVER